MEFKNAHIEGKSQDESFDQLKQKQIVTHNKLFNYNSSFESKSISKDKVVVAVLDSGINQNHTELKGIVKKSFNALNNSNDLSDNFGHGTAIAGLIASKNDDSIGVSKNVVIYSVKVIQDNGEVNVSDFIGGLRWAIDENVDVINISLGFNTGSKELKDIVDEAVNSGIIIVASSGNTNGLNAQYPARFENVISIGVVNEQLLPTKLSAIGKIDFVAPGTNLISLDNHGEYSQFNGSSFSTALVSGVIVENLYNLDIKKGKNTFSEVMYLLKKNSKGINLNKEKVGNGVPTFP
ncbi:S8 family peptidase [Peribacillus frigoritolerans]|uniref:S8 family serine peptidase n=1 Tax=Peribacillus frigoritolerans TaxID=450367 RepID=A0AAJ1QT63_9BACI|nr:S8 family serine peptidase [Peribacillus frigoritolerans]MDM5286907.1 S8 family serine peptidase [Peribacillus frigoritolerans]